MDIHFITKLDYEHSKSGLRVYATACGEVVQVTGTSLPLNQFAGQGISHCSACEAAPKVQVTSVDAIEVMEIAESVDVGDGKGGSAEQAAKARASRESLRKAHGELRDRINRGDTKGIVAGRNGLRLTSIKTYHEAMNALGETHDQMPEDLTPDQVRKIESRDKQISKDYEEWRSKIPKKKP